MPYGGGPALPEGPGESHPRALLAYPYAVEHEGRLFVGYSNKGGEVGRARTDDDREIPNSNSIELAVIPVESLVAMFSEAGTKKTSEKSMPDPPGGRSPEAIE